jgi:hypothetical protein
LLANPGKAFLFVKLIGFVVRVLPNSQLQLIGNTVIAQGAWSDFPQQGPYVV